jgi:WD40 repeat protein
LRKLQKVKIGSGSVGGIAFLPGGRNLAAALTSDSTVKIVDSAKGAIAQTLPSKERVFRWTLDVSPDGRWLAASEGKTVTVWDLKLLGLR